MSRGSAPVVSRSVLIGSLLVTGVLAAAPFLIASVVSERRIVESRTRASEIAGVLRHTGIANFDGVQVLIGSGNRPLAGEHAAWLLGSSAPLAHPISGDDPLTVDPWRNAYLVNVGASGTIWVLSAGPNGIVETPFEGAAAPGGDDIAERVR